MALMDARLFERYAIIINYHRYYISDDILTATGIFPRLETFLHLDSNYVKNYK